MKKVLPAALALTMVMSTVPVFAETTDTPLLISPAPTMVISPNPMANNDVAGTIYETAVTKLLEENIVSGYKDGSFKPEAAITRAEVCAMLVKAGNLLSDETASDDKEAIDEETMFSDLHLAPWAESFIAAASDAGIVSGYKDGTFRPTNNISVNELTVMVGKASGLKSDELKNLWTDEGNVLATRGEAAVAVCDALERIEAAAEAGYVPEVENEVVTKPEGIGYEVFNATNEFTGTPLVLSLEEAVAKMQTESIQAETAELNKASDKNKAAGYGDSYSAMEEAMKYMDYLPLSTQYEMQQEGLTGTNEEILKLQRDFARANIENNYQTELNSIRLSTIQTYYGLLQADDALRIQEENLQVQKDLLATTQRKYELGTVSKIELLTAENSVITAENDVTSAKNMVAQAKMAVNMLLEQPLMNELQLTTRYEAVELPQVSLTEAINSAMNQRNELVSAEFSQKVMEINFKSTRYRYGTQSSKYKEAEVQMKQVEQLCTMMPANIEMDIRTRYADVHAKYDAVKAAENTLAFAKEGYRISTITYEAGMNTISDVHQAQVSVLGAELGLSSAIASYNQAVYEFEVAMGHGVERISF